MVKLWKPAWMHCVFAYTSLRNDIFVRDIYLITSVAVLSYALRNELKFLKWAYGSKVDKIDPEESHELDGK